MTNSLIESETLQKKRTRVEETVHESLRMSGVCYQKSRPTAAESDAEEQEAFREELKKAAGDGRRSSLYQSNQEIHAS